MILGTQEKKKQLPKILLGLSFLFLLLTSWFIWIQMESAEKGFLYRQAKELEQLGKYKQAEEVYLDLYQLDTSVNVEYALAKIQYKNGKIAEAEQRMKKALTRCEKPVSLEFIQSYTEIIQKKVGGDSLEKFLPEVMSFTGSNFYFGGSDQKSPIIWIIADDNPNAEKLKTWVTILKSLYPEKAVRLDVVKLTNKNTKPIQGYFWQTYSTLDELPSDVKFATHTHTQDSSFSDALIQQNIILDPLHYYWFGYLRHQEVQSFQTQLLKTIKKQSPDRIVTFFKDIHWINLISYHQMAYRIDEEMFSSLSSNILEALEQKLIGLKKDDFDAIALHKGIQSILNKRGNIS